MSIKYDQFHVLHMSHDTKNFGKWGEDMAEQYLVTNGYKILQRNYRNFFGEIDIITIKNGIVVFVEVKTRDSLHANHFLPEQSVNYRKQSKLRKLCEMFNVEHRYENKEWQIDVISVILNKSTKKAVINHIQNAVYG